MSWFGPSWEVVNGLSNSIVNTSKALLATAQAVKATTERVAELESRVAELEKRPFTTITFTRDPVLESPPRATPANDSPTP